MQISWFIAFIQKLKCLRIELNIMNNPVDEVIPLPPIVEFRFKFEECKSITSCVTRVSIYIGFVIFITSITTITAATWPYLTILQRNGCEFSISEWKPHWTIVVHMLNVGSPRVVNTSIFHISRFDWLHYLLKI